MTAAMGLLACFCRICLPRQPFEDEYDELDHACIDTVRRVGWQVIAVGCEAGCGCGAADETPAFAYTLGLRHRAGRPDLAISGLPPSMMHDALNAVAERVVVHGLRLRPGDVLETVLPNAPVTVERVSLLGRDEIGLGSRSSWFHRGDEDVLALVWPTTSGVFAWQPGAPADARQPPSWRVPATRTGALAADPPWPFPLAPDAFTIVCTHLRQDNEPVRSVAAVRDGNGAMHWDIHCGRDHGDGIDQLQGEHFAHTVRAAPSLRELSDLRPGEYAERDDAFTPWRRGRLD